MGPFFWIALTFLLLFAPPTWAGSLSFSTDFDGTGSGSGFSIDTWSPSSSYGPRSSSQSSNSDQEFLKQRYEEQAREAQKEAQRRAEEEELRRQRERAKERDDLEELKRCAEKLQQLEGDETTIIQRMRYKQQVLALMVKFDQARKDYLATLQSYWDRLVSLLNQLPTPYRHRHYDRILILGLWKTPDDARNMVKRGENKDPFSKNNEVFDDIFAFGTKGLPDLSRCGLDYLLSAFNSLSPQTKSKLGKLKGAEVDELVCHSNGCRVAEVLIATGMLKVKKLRILGGQGVLMDLGDLQRLKVEKGIEEISVYVIKNDIVPSLSDVGWKIVDLTTKIGGPLQSFNNRRNDPTSQFLGITERPKFNPDAEIQVQTLTYPAASEWDIVANHEYKNYYRIIKGRSMSGCLTKEGKINPRCQIY